VKCATRTLALAVVLSMLPPAANRRCEGAVVSDNESRAGSGDTLMTDDEGLGAEKAADSSERQPAEKGKKKWKGKPPRLHGYIQVFYRYAFETGVDGLVDNDNFRVQRVRLKVDGKVLPCVSYEVDVDPRAPEISGILRDAFIGLELIPTQQVRLGQQKMPFGYENWVSSSRLFAVNRTELSDNISRGLNLRDIGVALVGAIPLSERWRLEDALAVSNGAGLNVQNDDTHRFNFWGRLAARYAADEFWAELGGSAATGDFNDSAEYVAFNRVGADLEVDMKWLFVSTEFAMALDSTAEAGVGESDEIPGFYFNVVGKTPWPVGPVARVDLVGDEYRRWTLGLYYGRASARFRVLVNYELREIFEDQAGNLDRGDDKLYVWSQVRF
jgi:hypothetical protein